MRSRYYVISIISYNNILYLITTGLIQLKLAVWDLLLIAMSRILSLRLIHAMHALTSITLLNGTNA